MVAALATLGTPVKPKRRQPRQGPFYFKKRKSTRIRQGNPQPPSKIPIIIDESAKKKGEVRPSEGNIEEVTSPKAKTKQHVLPMGRTTTRAVTFKRLKTQVAFLQEETRDATGKIGAATGAT